MRPLAPSLSGRDAGGGPVAFPASSVRVGPAPGLELAQEPPWRHDKEMAWKTPAQVPESFYGRG